MKSELEILKTLKPNKGKSAAFYGVAVDDIIKLLETPDKTHRWDNDYFNKVDNVINKLKNS